MVHIVFSQRHESDLAKYKELAEKLFSKEQLTQISFIGDPTKMDPEERFALAKKCTFFIGSMFYEYSATFYKAYLQFITSPDGTSRYGSFPIVFTTEFASHTVQSAALGKGGYGSDAPLHSVFVSEKTPYDFKMMMEVLLNANDFRDAYKRISCLFRLDS